MGQSRVNTLSDPTTYYEQETRKWMIGNPGCTITLTKRLETGRIQGKKGKKQKIEEDSSEEEETEDRMSSTDDHGDGDEICMHAIYAWHANYR
ncbi:hypothetical protein CEXT_199711 [Caerostris extrusa]|uniref:Uncharacterized protein n=1 Tax=Caerostris extrusa TaxID=172846 RepID=A0AAV4MHC9_CAEEX|nr:hypothetical protein CEXT_199711 [Caerostris extrusa]